MPDTNKHIVLKGIAGLGNRILALLSGCLYARLAGRTLYVDWRDGGYAERGDNAFSHLFRSPCCHPVPAELPSGTVWPDAWTGRLDLAVADVRWSPPYRVHATPWDVLSADHSRLDYPEDILVLWSYFENVQALRPHFDGPLRHLRGRSTKAVLRAVHDQCLRPEPGIQARIDDCRASYLDGTTIGVHVRYSDKRSRMRPIRRHVDRLLRRNPGARLFVATDNIDVLRDFEARYPAVLSTDKWYPDPGAAMHTAADCPDRIAGGIEALVDIHLLASCDYLVADERSAFAYVASTLFDKPSRRIHNVQRARFVPASFRRWLWARWRSWRWDPDVGPVVAAGPSDRGR